MFGVKKSSRDDLISKHCQFILSELPTTKVSRTEGGACFLYISIPSKFETFSLQVDLSSHDFPQSPPELKLVNFQGKRHYLMNSSNGIFLFPHLAPSSWNPHSNLGKILKTIVHDLSKHPPQTIDNHGLVSDTGHPSPSVSYYSSAKVTESGHSRGPGSMSEMLENSLPVVPSRYEQLEAMSLEDVQKLLEHEVLFQKVMFEQDVYKSVSKMKDNLRKSVLHLAKSNLDNKDTIDNLKNEVAVLKLVCEEEEGRKKLLDLQKCKYIERYSIDKVIKAYRKIADDADDEASEISRAFRNGDMSTTDFTKQYVENRLHGRKCSIIEELLSIQSSE